MRFKSRGNTSWVYNDNVGSETIKKWLGKSVNSEDLARSDKWLNMMYPRLTLLHKLLKEDGVIFISIDDNEVANLRLLLNEIFGENNFIGQFVWRKRTGSNDALMNLSTDHEYILVYGKGEFSSFIGNKKEFKNYKNPDNDPRGDYRLLGLWARQQGGSKFSYKMKDGYFLEERLWLVNSESMRKLENDDRIVRVNDKLYRKLFIYENQGSIPETIWLDSSNNANAKDEIKEIFEKKSSLFDTPKPTKLLKKILKLATNPNSNDIILDSFAGSGTTAQAVLEMNKEDGGNRKFILIEMEKHIAKPITAERVKRVINGYSYKGKVKTELYTKKLTSSQVLNPKTMTKVSDEVAKIIEAQKPHFSKIEKKFENNTISINGVQEVTEFKDGIDGSFKFCQLGKQLYSESGVLNLELPISTVAKHIHFLEFKQPLKRWSKKSGNFIGEYQNRFLYFFLDKKFTQSELSSILLTLNDDYSEIVVYTENFNLSTDVIKENRVKHRNLRE